MSSRGDPTIQPLLHRLLAARPESRQEFEDVSEAIGWDADDAFGVLHELGVVELGGDAIRIIDPVQALSRNATAALVNAREAFEEAQQALGLLSKVKSTAAGSAPGADMIGAVIRDHDHVWQEWWESHSRTAPVNPGVVMPDAVMLKNQVLADIDRVAADFAAGDYHMRVILDLDECVDDAGRAPEWLQTLAAAGVEARGMIDPPSWFYVDDGVIGGVPLTWGQGNPAGMVMLYPSPLLTLAAAYFETLWERAAPIRVGSASAWEPVLRLLEAGSSDQQIADAVGIGLRTVRRRIAEAMDELGATTRFELGVRWAGRRDRASRPTPTPSR